MPRRSARPTSGRHLGEQRGLADTRLAADEGDRARHQAAAEHPVELVDAGRRSARTRLSSSSASRNRRLVMTPPAHSDRPMTAPGASPPITDSTRVFQLPHSLQRPIHLGRLVSAGRALVDRLRTGHDGQGSERLRQTNTCSQACEVRGPERPAQSARNNPLDSPMRRWVADQARRTSDNRFLTTTWPTTSGRSSPSAS